METIIRTAQAADEAAILELATGFATSFVVAPAAFRASFESVLTQADCRLVVAEVEREVVGYVLAFAHLAFYANGHVAWVEEIVVQAQRRGRGVGRLLMQDVEGWAAQRGCTLIALATRRAAEFYRALGYAESASYFRKLL